MFMVFQAGTRHLSRGLRVGKITADRISRGSQNKLRSAPCANRTLAKTTPTGTNSHHPRPLMDRTVQAVTASSTSHPRPLPRLDSAENHGGRSVTSVMEGVPFAQPHHQNHHASLSRAQFTAVPHLLRTRPPPTSLGRSGGLYAVRARSPRAQRFSQNYCS